MSRKTKGRAFHATELYCSQRHEAPLLVKEEPRKIMKIWRNLKTFFCTKCQDQYAITSGVMTKDEIAGYKFKQKYTNIHAKKIIKD